MRAHDGRGRATRLLPMLLDHLRIVRAEDLMTLVYLQDFHVHQIAALAPLVEQAAREGDDVARDILGSAAEELALAARTVVEALRMQDEE
jgi:N-acetylglucosamine kinase